VTEILNGADTSPLTGWVIAIAHGKTLVGLPTSDPESRPPLKLLPVYELIAMMQLVQSRPDQPPQLMTMRQCFPLLTFPSIRVVTVPDNAIVIEVEMLSRQERRELGKAVEGCEHMIGAMRAHDAGIVLAPPGARVKQP